MKADKMFEELGYYRKIDNKEKIEYKNVDGNSIRFYLNNKGFAAFVEEMRYRPGVMAMLTMQELQAINKKCEELGWRII